MTQTFKHSRKVVSFSGVSNPISHDFILENSEHLKVYADDTLLQLGVDYTIDGVGELDGYDVNLIIPDEGEEPDWWSSEVLILSVEPYIDQGDDISLGGSFGARFEDSLDRLTRRVQYVYDMAWRSFKSPLTTDPADLDQASLILDPLYYAPAIRGLPAGGLTGQVPVKNSEAEGDVSWKGAAPGSGDMFESYYAPIIASKVAKATLFDEPVLPSFTGAVATPLRLVSQSFIDPSWFGLSGGSVEDEAYAKAMAAAVEDGKVIVVGKGVEHTLDVVDLSAVTAGGILRLRMDGKLTHVDGSSDDMFNLGERDYVEIFGPGEFDGQKDEQTDNRIIIPVAQVARFHLNGPIFRNVKQGAVHQQSPNAESFIMENFRCYEGGLHDGTTGGQACSFVSMRAGKYNRVENFRMVHSVDPLPNQNRNPAGVVYVNTGAGDPSEHVIIKKGYLENLGYSSAGNHLGAVDFYSRASNIEIEGLRIRKPRFHPIRLNYSDETSVKKCDIELPYQLYENDTTPYADAAGINASMADRGYPTDGGDTGVVTVEGNRIAISGVNECRGISFVNGDLDYLYNKAVAKDNVITHSGTNATSNGLFFHGVLDMVDDNNKVQGFTRSRCPQGTSTAGAARAALKARYTIRGGRSVSCPIGLFARTDVLNMDIDSTGWLSVGATTFDFTIQNAGDVLFRGGRMSGGPQDASGNDSFRMEGVKGVGGVSNLISNDFYEIKECQGRRDQASYQFEDYAGQAADADVTLTPGTDGSKQIFTGARAASRLVTLSATNAVESKTTFYIENLTTGNFALRIGALGALRRGEWMIVAYNGTAYYVVARGTLTDVPYVTAVEADATFTYNPHGHSKFVILDTPLTAAKTVTLSVTNAIEGDTIEFLRTAAATGAFDWNIGAGTALKVLSAASMSAKVVFTAGAWRLLS